MMKFFFVRKKIEIREDAGIKWVYGSGIKGNTMSLSSWANVINAFLARADAEEDLLYDFSDVCGLVLP